MTNLFCADGRHPGGPVVRCLVAAVAWTTCWRWEGRAQIMTLGLRLPSHETDNNVLVTFLSNVSSPSIKGKLLHRSNHCCIVFIFYYVHCWYGQISILGHWRSFLELFLPPTILQRDWGNVGTCQTAHIRYCSGLPFNGSKVLFPTKKIYCPLALVFFPLQFT